LTRSFFERHPEHLHQKIRISQEETSTLWADMKLYEEARLALLELLSELERQ
jgi:hypothetical protein